MASEVAVLLYPGCIFFEIALAAEVLRPYFPVRFYTPDGQAHEASNGARLQASGDLAALAIAPAQAVLVPGGDPRSVLLPQPLPAQALQAQAKAGAVVAGICAGNLVMAACELLRGRRGTHNYTAEHAPTEKVEATAAYWQGLHFERADVVRDGAIITAQPWAYRAYAAELALALGVMDADAARALRDYPVSRSYGRLT